MKRYYSTTVEADVDIDMWAAMDDMSDSEIASYLIHRKTKINTLEAQEMSLSSAIESLYKHRHDLTDYDLHKLSFIKEFMK